MNITISGISNKGRKKYKPYNDTTSRLERTNYEQGKRCYEQPNQEQERTN